MRITHNAYIRTVLARLLGFAVVLEDLFYSCFFKSFYVYYTSSAIAAAGISGCVKRFVLFFYLIFIHIIRTVLARLLGLAVVLEDLFRADCYVAPRVRGIKKLKN